MKKITLAAILLSAIAETMQAQCTSLFSYTANFETASFANQSAISNGHFFWNFGDGTGSNLPSPSHRFPENGNYLVTLFAEDTLSGCNTFYETWINVTKYSTNPCQPVITDSIYTTQSGDLLSFIDNSPGCSNYLADYDGGPGLNFPISWQIVLGGYWQTIPFRMVCRAQYYNANYDLKREAYKTAGHNYSSTKNYDSCSANFEFKVVYQDSIGQKILFKAMNSTAKHYEWYIAGFGNPITSTNDTISQFYPFNSNDIWQTGLIIEGQNGCHDTLYQNILARDTSQAITGISEPANEAVYTLYPNPFHDKVYLGFPATKEIAKLFLFNTTGELVRLSTVTTGGQEVIERGDLPAGLYYFILRTDEKIIAQGKLVAE